MNGKHEFGKSAMRPGIGLCVVVKTKNDKYGFLCVGRRKMHPEEYDSLEEMDKENPNDICNDTVGFVCQWFYHILYPWERCFGAEQNSYNVAYVRWSQR